MPASVNYRIAIVSVLAAIYTAPEFPFFAALRGSSPAVMGGGPGHIEDDLGCGGLAMETRQACRRSDTRQKDMNQ